MFFDSQAWLQLAIGGGGGGGLGVAWRVAPSFLLYSAASWVWGHSPHRGVEG